MIISDENATTTNIMNKLNVAGIRDMKRGVLHDLGSNRMTSNISLKNVPGKPASRLPVPKAR